MEDLLIDLWRHQGCSLVWDEASLLTALGGASPYALHTAFRWPQGGFPQVAVRAAIVVAGLQVCLELASTPVEAENLLRRRVQPLIRAWQTERPSSALIFALAPSQDWSFDANDRARLTMRGSPIEVGRALWSGAAGEAQRIMVERSAGSAKAPKPQLVFGGLYARRLS